MLTTFPCSSISLPCASNRRTGVFDGLWGVITSIAEGPGNIFMRGANSGSWWNPILAASSWARFTASRLCTALSPGITPGAFTDGLATAVKFCVFGSALAGAVDTCVPIAEGILKWSLQDDPWELFAEFALEILLSC